MPYIEYETREEWEQSFKTRLGASEIGIVCGKATYKTPLQLWMEKTGKKQPDDLSDNERVSYGTNAEEHLRALFALKHKDKYTVEYHRFRVYYSKHYKFLTATLDGELTELETGRKGIYECKTALIQSRKDFEEWDNRIPDKYYCQLCQQLNATDFDFAILNAELRFPDGSAEIKEYPLERAEAEDDIKYVVGEGVEFWDRVTTGRTPTVKFMI